MSVAYCDRCKIALGPRSVDRIMRAQAGDALPAPKSLRFCVECDVFVSGHVAAFAAREGILPHDVVLLLGGPPTVAKTREGDGSITVRSVASIAFARRAS